MTTSIETSTTASDQIGAAGTLLSILSAHRDLPAVTISLQNFRTESLWGLRIDVHDGLTTFERWREALGFDPTEVTHDQAGSLGWLKVHAAFAGVPVEMYGYYDVLDNDEQAA
ncbi:hypothetical protein [Kitasatospora sp. HPMI-4]|uniref:hypothetical protein n=1 Tax=Kitasatospora sp. HPMI-4 TaxID=3448443 RepID=UPI003F1D5A5D